MLAGYRGAGRCGAVTLWNTGTKYDDQARRWAQRIGWQLRRKNDQFDDYIEVTRRTDK